MYKRNSFCTKVVAFISIALFISAQYIFCQSERTIPITVERNRTIIPVQITNSGTLKLVLDSGMPMDGILLYDSGLKDSISGLTFRETKIPGAGAGPPSKGYFADSANFNIGKIKFTNQRIIILDNEKFKGFPSDGVIGYSILGHYATEINYDKNLITLHEFNELQLDDSWNEIPIYFKNNKQIPWVNVSMSTYDEQPVQLSVYIDYASGEAIELLERPDQKFIIPEKTSRVYLGRGLSGDIYGSEGRISRLIIGPHVFNNVKAVFTPANVRSKQKNADGIIANNVLRRFNLVFDYRDKKLYLKPNSFYEQPF